MGSILHRKINYKKYFSNPILILAKCDSSSHVNLAQEVLKEPFSTFIDSLKTLGICSENNALPCIRMALASFHT